MLPVYNFKYILATMGDYLCALFHLALDALSVRRIFIHFGRVLKFFFKKVRNKSIQSGPTHAFRHNIRFCLNKTFVWMTKVNKVISFAWCDLNLTSDGKKKATVCHIVRLAYRIWLNNLQNSHKLLHCFLSCTRWTTQMKAAYLQ